MSATLATLKARVQQILADTGSDIWSSDDLDEAIRQALHEYSKARPAEAIGTVTLAADGREISLSTLTGILDVQRVWCGYTAADPEYPPNERSFEWWPDSKTIRVLDAGYEPQSGDVARVFYTKLQTLKDLDAATATTFLDDDESLIAQGASGYAATSRAADLAEKVTLDRLSAQQLRAWGLAQLQRFRSGLKVISSASALRGDARQEVDELDRWDGDWA